MNHCEAAHDHYHHRHDDDDDDSDVHDEEDHGGPSNFDQDPTPLNEPTAMREDKDKSRGRDGEVEDEEEVGEEGGKKAKLRRSARLKKLEEMLAPEDVALFDEADERGEEEKNQTRSKFTSNSCESQLACKQKRSSVGADREAKLQNRFQSVRPLLIVTDSNERGLEKCQGLNFRSLIAAGGFPGRFGLLDRVPLILKRQIALQMRHLKNERVKKKEHLKNFKQGELKNEKSAG